MKKNLSDIIRAADMVPFASTWRSNKNDEARDMMGDRSYFYDASTLAFFGCRVAWCGPRMDGAVMVAVMSQKAGFSAAAGREWRYAVHDFTGHHISGDDSYTSRARAEKALDAALVAIDPAAIVRDALQREKATAARKARCISGALRMVPRVRKAREAQS